MEGSEPVDCAVSNVNQTRKANDGRLYRHCPRAEWLHVGRCKGGAVDQIVSRRIELAPRAQSIDNGHQSGVSITPYRYHLTAIVGQCGSANDH